MEHLRRLFGWLNRIAEEVSGGPEERIIREALTRGLPAECDEHQLECEEPPCMVLSSRNRLVRLAYYREHAAL